MRQREEIPASIDLPQTPPARRMEAVEKARQMMTPPTAPSPPTNGQVKLTTRVPADLVEWLKAEVKRYRSQHPRVPKLTIEELMRVAIENLKEAKNIDALVTRHRGL